MFCQYCGQRNEDTSQTCTACQKPLASEPRGAGFGVRGAEGVRRVNKGFYLGSIAGAGLLGVLIVVLTSARVQRNPNDLSAFPLLFLGEMIIVYAGVIFALLLYKSWRAIQDGQVRTTPGKAVGFLFIPFYNFYWAFVAYWGFAKDYNQYIVRHAIDAKPLTEGLYLASCILILASFPLAFFPGVRLVAPFASWIVWVLVANGMCNAVNSVAGTGGEPAS